RLAAATRNHPQVRVGVSPRGVIALTRAACSYALISGRGFVLPEDLKTLIKPVFAHRVLLSADAQLRGVTADEVLEDAVRSVAVPLPDSPRVGA
ncbi:MAG: MoxR-like ATPase, partial [Actinoplanes sp.]|nr:MoxR-like ATPase [Actinoplanes sp.]